MKDFSKLVIGAVVVGAGIIAGHPTFAATNINVITQAVSPAQFQTTTQTVSNTSSPSIPSGLTCGMSAQVDTQGPVVVATTAQKFNVVDITTNQSVSWITPAPQTITYTEVIPETQTVSHTVTSTSWTTPAPITRTTTITHPGHSEPIFKTESYQVPLTRWEPYQVPVTRWESYTVPIVSRHTYYVWGWIRTGGSHWGVVGEERYCPWYHIPKWNANDPNGAAPNACLLGWAERPRYGWVPNGHYGEIPHTVTTIVGYRTVGHSVVIGSKTEWHQVTVGSRTETRRVQVGTRTTPTTYSYQTYTVQPPAIPHISTQVVTSVQTTYSLQTSTRLVQSPPQEHISTSTSSQVIGSLWQTISTRTVSPSTVTQTTVYGLCPVPTGA